MSQIGLFAPDFQLEDLDGITHRLSEMRGRNVLLSFWSAECPWSEAADQEIKLYLPEWNDQVVWWSIAVNTNEPIELLRQVAQVRGLPLVLNDKEQLLVNLYKAQTTPHTYVIDQWGILRYRGAVNNRTFRQKTPTHFYLYDAIKNLLNGETPELAETPAYGCSIVQHP